MIDPDGNTWSYTYDAYGDKVSERAPATSDGSGVTDPYEQVTRWAYDTGTGWVTAEMTGRFTSANPSATTCTPPAGGCTTYTYNNDGQVLTTTDGDGHTTTDTYDADGNLASVTDPETNETKYAYNLADRQVSKTLPDGSATTTDYTLDGQVQDQLDAAGQGTHYTYDLLGNLSSTTPSWPRTTS